jgi:hypothetical protein
MRHGFLALALCMLLALPVQAALIGQWHFEAGAGTTAVSSVGVTNTITFTGTQTWPAGKVGTFAAHTDATGPVYGEFTGANALVKGLSNASIAVWVKPTVVTGTNQAVVFEVTGSTDQRLALFINTDGSYACNGRGISNDAGGSITQRKSNGVVFTNNVWTHIVCTWSGSTGVIAIYVDGAVPPNTLTAAGTVEPFGTTTPSSLPSLGTNAAGTGNYCTCDIDEVNLYDHALSATEVSDLYVTYGGAPPSARQRRLITW